MGLSAIVFQMVLSNGGNYSCLTLVFDNSSTNCYSTELMLGTMNTKLKRIQLVDVRCFNTLFTHL